MHATHRILVLVVVSVLVTAFPAYSQAPPVDGVQIDVDLYGNIYLLNSEANSLKILSKEKVVLREVGGSGWQNDQFDRPAGVWARNGIDVFVADYGNHRIQRFDRQLSYVSTLSTRESDNPDERFGYPEDVVLSRIGNLFICDTENSRIVKVDGTDKVQITFGGFGGGKGKLHHPTRVKIGPGDFVYVLDTPRVLVYDMFGNFVRELFEGLLKNPASLFADENGVAVLDGNMLYCFDREIRPTGSIQFPLPSMGPAEKTRALTFGNGLLYLLTDKDLHVLPDPRNDLQNGDLEKSEKSQ